MTPEVESVVISITTAWEGASAQEIETDVIELQEARLGNLTGLVQMTSESSAGSGTIRLEFATGTPIADARTEVDLKLAEVPGYPEAVLKPVVVDVDPEVAVERLVAGRGFTATDARNRISRQASRSQRLERADLVVDNSGTLDDLVHQVDLAWEWIATLQRPEPGAEVRRIGSRAEDA